MTGVIHSEELECRSGTQGQVAGPRSLALVVGEVKSHDFLRGTQKQRRLTIAPSLSGDDIDAVDAEDFIPPDVMAGALLRQETEDTVSSQISVLQQMSTSC